MRSIDLFSAPRSALLRLHRHAIVTAITEDEQSGNAARGAANKEGGDTGEILFMGENRSPGVGGKARAL